MAVPSRHLQEPTEPQAGFSILSQPVKDGCVHVTMAGDLDLAAVDRAATVLDRSLDEADSVLCHLGSLGFIDWCGLQCLLHAAARARRKGVRLTLTDSPPVLTRLLTLLGLEDALDLGPDATSMARERLRLVAPPRRGDL